MKTIHTLLASTMLLALPLQSHGAMSDADPLESVMWEYLLKNELLIPAEDVVFDDRVQVYAPAAVEDGMNVPVSVRVEGLEGIEEIVVLADHNPIQRVLNYFPGDTEPFIAFRMKVQESTPIRAAVRTAGGKWHVGGVWLDAPGGGCTTSSASQASRLWEGQLNQVSAQVWSRDDGGDRLRMRVIHPMDTGLVPQTPMTVHVPAFFIESMRLEDGAGNILAHMQTFEPVSENPVFTFAVPPGSASSSGYQLVGSDNNGNAFSANVARSDNRLALNPTPAIPD